MKKIELSEDFFPTQQSGHAEHAERRDGRQRNAVGVILGRTNRTPEEEPRPRRRSRPAQPTARSPYVLVATLPFVLARNLMSLTASIFRAGLPGVSSHRR